MVVAICIGRLYKGMQNIVRHSRSVKTLYWAGCRSVNCRRVDTKRVNIQIVRFYFIYFIGHIHVSTLI